MAKKPYSSRLLPQGEHVLVRKPPLSSLIKIAGSKHAQGISRAIVVAVGPGEYRDGLFITPSKDLKPGVTILTDAQYFSRFEDINEMEEEGLFFVPASLIVFIEQPK